MSQQHLLKLIIIGDCGVGKTNILMRYCQNTFKLNYVSTIGVDFKIKTMQIGDTRIKFQIWDTAGQQRYRNIAQTYYKGAAGIILTYAVNDQKSFTNIQKWMKQINQHAPDQVRKILIANKMDVNQDQRQVQELQGKTLAHKFGIDFLEVSAKTGENVNQVFNTLGKNIVENYIPNMKRDQSAMFLSKQLEKQKQRQLNKNQCQC